MRLDELEKSLIREQVERLVSMFPFARIDKLAMATELLSGTRGWTASEFIGAMTIAIRDADNHPPRLGKILKSRPSREIVPGSPRDPDVCASCGVAYYVAGYELYNGTVHGKSRCDCPQANPAGWDTERARAWREGPPLAMPPRSREEREAA